MGMLTSAANPKIKAALALYEKKGREDAGSFVLEGPAEIGMALAAGVKFKTVFYCAELLNQQTKPLCEKIEAEKVEIDRNLFERVAYRGTVNGLWAVALQPKTSIEKLKFGVEPLFLVIEKVEKPGNLGGILRTADAAGVSAVFVTEELSDLYNPNIVRASLGAIFSVPVFSLTNAEAYDWLTKNKVKVVAATPAGAADYTSISYKGATAIAIGSEKDGLSDFWLKKADIEKGLIPMAGKVNSLNASVSTAIITYEAVRQRSGK